MATNGNIGRRAIVVPKVRYPLPLLLESGNPQDIERIESYDLGISLEVAVVESKYPWNSMLDHQRNKPRVVRLLSLNRVFGKQSLPRRVHLRGLGQKLE